MPQVAEATSQVQTVNSIHWAEQLRIIDQSDVPRQADQECTLLYKADLLRDNGLIRPNPVRFLLSVQGFLYRLALFWFRLVSAAASSGLGCIPNELGASSSLYVVRGPLRTTQMRRNTQHVIR